MFGADCASCEAAYYATLEVDLEVGVLRWDRHRGVVGGGLGLVGEVWMTAEDSNDF